jgi:hypothetical protein
MSRTLVLAAIALLGIARDAPAGTIVIDFTGFLTPGTFVSTVDIQGFTFEGTFGFDVLQVGGVTTLEVRNSSSLVLVRADDGGGFLLQSISVASSPPGQPFDLSVLQGSSAPLYHVPASSDLSRIDVAPILAGGVGFRANDLWQFGLLAITTIVPEPSTLALCGIAIALGAAAWAIRRFRRPVGAGLS